MREVHQLPIKKLPFRKLDLLRGVLSEEYPNAGWLLDYMHTSSDLDNDAEGKF